jgi:hypothetical protein
VSDVALIDRAQIYDLMVRYGRANDTADVDLVRTCFTGDLTAEVVPWTERFEGIEAFLVSWTRGTAAFASTHHFSNFTFDVDGDAGSYSCLLIAQHWPRGTVASAETPMYTIGGLYENRVRRTPEGWRITELLLTILWCSGDPQVLGHLGPHVSKPAAQLPRA